jgi:DNA-binding transcriptional LysR family regulator
VPPSGSPSLCPRRGEAVPALRSIELFLVVAAERSYTRAALATGVSEPALSRTVRTLETEVGGPLVRRAGQRGLELTGLGEYVVSLAAGVTAGAAQLAEYSAQVARGEVGRLVLGWPAHGLGRLGEVLLRGLRVRRSGIALTTIRPDLAAGLAPLHHGRCDVLLVHGVPEDRRGYRFSRPFAREARVVAVASPLADPATLAGLPVVPAGTPWDARPGDTFGPLPVPDLREPARTVAELFERVRRGEGAAVVPAGLAAHYRPADVRFLPTDDVEASVARFAWRADTVNPSVAAAVETLLRIGPHHPDLGGLP